MKNLTIALLAMVSLAACTKTEITSPEFNVSFANKSYKERDTVLFTLEGNAENVVFYPGTPGFSYENRNRIQAAGVPTLSFSTTLNYVGETNTLKLLASTDFNGKYTAEGVQAASWIDITSRALLATSTTARASGNIDLSDFLTPENKRVYLAFRYLGYNHATLKQPKWALTVFSLNNVLTDGTPVPISVATDLGWAQVDFKNETTQWALPATGLVSIDGTTVGAAPKTNDDNDDWVITKPLDLRKVNPDLSVPLKNLGSAKVETFPFIYEKAGTYTGVFVGFNSVGGEKKEVIREFSITINP